LKLDADAGLHQVCRPQAHKQRNGGDNLEIEDRLATDASHGLHVAGAGDSAHQRAEQQRRDDRLDPPKEDGAQHAHLFGRARVCICEVQPEPRE